VSEISSARFVTTQILLNIHSPICSFWNYLLNEWKGPGRRWAAQAPAEPSAERTRGQAERLPREAEALVAQREEPEIRLGWYYLDIFLIASLLIER